MNKTLADILRSYIPDGDGYNSEYAHNLNAAADALESQQSAPAGYVMVPVEPSEKMLDILYHNGPGLDDHLLVAIWAELLAAAPKADVQCPAYSERIVPAPTALIQWAWEDEPESTLFDEGYNAARRWVKMQLEYAVSKAPQPVSDGARDALVEALEQLLSEVEGFNVSGVYFTEKCLGHKGYISAIAALDTYRAAKEKKV